MATPGAKVRLWTAAEDVRLHESARCRRPDLRRLSTELRRTYWATVKRASLIGARRNQKHDPSTRGPAVETMRECPECGRVFWAKRQRVYCGDSCRDLAAAERFEWFLTQPDRERAAAAEWFGVVVFA